MGYYVGSVNGFKTGRTSVDQSNANSTDLYLQKTRTGSVTALLQNNNSSSSIGSKPKNIRVVKTVNRTNSTSSQKNLKVTSTL